MGQIVKNIEIIAVGAPQHTPNAKGGYYKIDVAFKSDGKVQGKLLVDFKRPEIYNKALELKAGDVVSVTLEKEPGSDGKEYWQWVALGDAAPASASPTPSAASSSKPTGRVTGSTYETPEERAVKQVYIVRQSSITAALKFLEQTNTEASRDDVVDLASYFEEFVFKGKVAKAEEKKAVKKPAKKAEAIEDMDDDIPF